MEKVRFGIIGTGGMGTGHAKALQTLEETTLTAVCDVDKEVCGRTAETYGVPGFVEYHDLLDSGLVDAVIIATPTISIHPSGSPL